MQKNKTDETKIKISYSKLIQDINALAAVIRQSTEQYKTVYAVPRGGVIVGALIAQSLGLTLVEEPTDEKSCLVVDDLVDSGKTLDKYPHNTKAVLYTKPHSPGNWHYRVEELDGWIEFPYEDTNTDVEENFRRILEYLGEDPTREGLRETPKRYIKFMRQFLEKEEFKFTAFKNEGTDEMVIQKNIPFYSLCEHHTAPFFGMAHVAYIPGEKIVGLSKLARTVRHYASNFQNQERITTQVAERLEKELSPGGVAVMLEARHFCMEMRGVKTHDTTTVTTKLTGAFKDNIETRNEFMSIIGK